MLEQEYFINEKGQAIVDRLDEELTSDLSDIDYIKYCINKHWDVGFTVLQGNDYKLNLQENKALLFELEDLFHKSLFKSIEEDTSFYKYRILGLLNYFKTYKAILFELEKNKYEKELFDFKNNLLSSRIKRKIKKILLKLKILK